MNKFHSESTFLSPVYTLVQRSYTGFPGSSTGKESACSAGDPGSIPGLGRSSGVGIGCPLQFSCASLVAQIVKNLPAMSETWVWSPGEGHGYPFQYSCLENFMDREAWQATVNGIAKRWTQLSDWAQAHLAALVSSDTQLHLNSRSSLGYELIAPHCTVDWKIS